MISDAYISYVRGLSYSKLIEEQRNLKKKIKQLEGISPEMVSKLTVKMLRLSPVMMGRHVVLNFIKGEFQIK